MITNQPKCRVACFPAVTSTQTLHPHSAASFPDDAYSQPVIQASGNDGTDPRHEHSAAIPMQRVNLTRSWTTNKPLNDEAQSKYPDDTDEFTFKNIIIEQILNMLPSIPSISQDDHLSIQCGRWNDPTSLLLSWNRASLPFRSSNNPTVPTMCLNKYTATHSYTNM